MPLRFRLIISLLVPVCIGSYECRAQIDTRIIYNRLQKIQRGEIVLNRKHKELFSTDTLEENIYYCFKRDANTTSKIPSEFILKTDRRIYLYCKNYTYIIDDSLRTVRRYSFDTIQVLRTISDYIVPAVSGAGTDFYYIVSNNRTKVYDTVYDNTSYTGVQSETFSKKDPSHFRSEFTWLFRNSDTMPTEYIVNAYPNHDVKFNHIKINSVLLNTDRFSISDSITYILKERYRLNYKLTNFDSVYKGDNKVSLLAEGLQAPDFILKTYNDSGKIALGNIGSRVTIIDFYYISCAPCLKACPYLVKLKERYPDSMLTILAINPIDRKRSVYEKYRQSNRINYYLLNGDTVVTGKYHVSGFPTLYILDARKKIVYAKEAFSEYDYEVVIPKIINSLLTKN